MELNIVRQDLMTVREGLTSVRALLSFVRVSRHRVRACLPCERKNAGRRSDSESSLRPTLIGLDRF
jgi:hypothetical protein